MKGSPTHALSLIISILRRRRGWRVAVTVRVGGRRVWCADAATATRDFDGGGSKEITANACRAVGGYSPLARQCAEGMEKDGGADGIATAAHAANQDRDGERIAETSTRRQVRGSLIRSCPRPSAWSRRRRIADQITDGSTKSRRGLQQLDSRSRRTLAERSRLFASCAAMCRGHGGGERIAETSTRWRGRRRLWAAMFLYGSRGR